MRSLVALGMLVALGCGGPPTARRTAGDGDRCPNEPEDRDGFEDGDGCPDPDNDRDGLLDEEDPCPDVAGPCEDAAAQPTMTGTPRQTPWTVAYGDGSANQYRFSQASPGAEVLFEYVPVTPAQSSTGTYSGGDPVTARLPAADPRIDELWVRLQRLEANPALRAPARNKGTGAFTLTTPAGTRHFLIEQGPELDAIHAFLSGFRG